MHFTFRPEIVCVISFLVGGLTYRDLYSAVQGMQVPKRDVVTEQNIAAQPKLVGEHT